MNKEMLEEISSLPPNIEKELQKDIIQIMDRSGLFYRVFSRIKSPSSVEHKFTEHEMVNKSYSKDKKMQDIVGARIALYFKDDVEICRRLIESTYDVVDLSEDIEDKTNFKPMRLNYVCRLPQDIKDLFTTGFFDKYFIDDTFELQIRTVFSEGWHEIEHDLRYKCKEDWNDEDELWRTMNGIFATLETCDWSILALFERLTYKMYKSSNWEAMIRNKLRMRLASEPLSAKIKEIIAEDKQLAKDFLKLDRQRFVQAISANKLSRVPKTLNNILFIANALFIHNSKLKEYSPGYILDMCEVYEHTGETQKS